MNEIRSLMSECTGLLGTDILESKSFKELDSFMEELMIEGFSDSVSIKTGYNRDVYNFGILLKKKPILYNKVIEKAEELYSKGITEAKEISKELKNDFTFLNKFADELYLVTEAEEQKSFGTKIKEFPKKVLALMLIPILIPYMMTAMVSGLFNKKQVATDGEKKKEMTTMDLIKMVVKNFPFLIKAWANILKEVSKEVGSEVKSISNEFSDKFTGGISELVKSIKKLFKRDFDTLNKNKDI